jgi:hypothetical protein
MLLETIFYDFLPTFLDGTLRSHGTRKAPSGSTFIAGEQIAVVSSIETSANIWTEPTALISPVNVAVAAPTSSREAVSVA